jgi:hypothetical protein
VRAGYAIVRAKLFYGGYSGGVVSGQDGFNKSVVFSSTNGGITPAFLLQNGMPTNYQQPPFIDTGVDNGVGVSYNSNRDPTSGRLPYSMMWNLTIEHQFTPNFYVDVAYVANKGTHLLARLAKPNTLNPSFLSMGSKLYDQFGPGQTVLDGVQVPYPGWRDQMTSCPASVAQALLPYPQYCGNLQSENEQTGNSNFQSLQVKAERRFNRGLWFMMSYTNEKWMANTQSVQAWGDQTVSPYLRQRAKSIALSDIPQTLSAALTYDLPFGSGQRFLNTGGVLNKAVGGWQVSTIFRINSGAPLPIYSSLCNVPGQFAAGCFPGIIPGANPLAQTGGFDPNKPLFNKAAFESPAGFNFYTGQGNPIGHLRTRAYRNNDITLEKTTSLTERVKFGFYAQFFNAWNWHCFTAGSIIGPGSPFYTDVNNPNFGDITGVTTFPRNIQFGARFMF